ncbi:MAG: PIN domain nuclease [Candidatus Kapabacteria bacterium]|nr:PIN domain nuclease [Ignavibacteriota bacterium]MCW5885017.1 PIN domain nuclease [Candidatus Kapabacteria bacterium]
MIMVDSSVWINFFRGVSNETTDKLFNLLRSELVCVADLIVLEVLQGVSSDKEFNEIEFLFRNMLSLNILNMETAIQSAQNFRFLRKRGITIRKLNDCLIATYCIENNLTLLQDDKDFLPFRDFLGLRLLTN